MRFYTKPYQFYCGIDLHARSMYVCILEGVSELWICYAIRAKEKNGTTPRMARTYDYPSATLPTLSRHRSRATWENTARQATLSLSRDLVPRWHISV